MGISIQRSAHALVLFAFVLFAFVLVGLLGCSSEVAAPNGPAGGTPIAAEGGRVLEGAVQLVVPEGALAERTAITVEVHRADELVMPERTRAVSDVYRFGPEGLTFDRPATIEIAVDLADPAIAARAADTRLVLLTAPAGSSAWTVLGEGRLFEGRVRAATMHFSDFVIVIPDRAEDWPSWTQMFPTTFTPEAGTELNLFIDEITPETTVRIGLAAAELLEPPALGFARVRMPSQAESGDLFPTLEVTPRPSLEPRRLFFFLTYGTCPEAILSRFAGDIAHVQTFVAQPPRWSAAGDLRDAVRAASQDPGVIWARIAPVLRALHGTPPTIDDVAPFVGTREVEDVLREHLALESTVLDAGSLEHWLEAVATHYLGHPLDADAGALYVSRIAGGLPLDEVVRELEGSIEARTLRVDDAYHRLLRRAPSDAELRVAVDRLLIEPSVELWAKLASSDAYRQLACPSTARTDAGVADAEGPAPDAAAAPEDAGLVVPDAGEPATSDASVSASDAMNADAGPEPADGGVLEPEADGGVLEPEADGGGVGPAPDAGPGIHPIAHVVQSPAGTRVCAISTPDDGQHLYCWGYMSNGAFGDGSSELWRATPALVIGAGPNAVDQVRSVGVGERHTCFARDDGTAWCWGDNADGALGDGTTIARSTPVRVRDPAGAGYLEDVVEIVAGGFNEAYSCARLGTGRVLCWGGNTWAEIATRDPLSSPINPLPVDTGIADVTAIAPGLHHVCVLAGPAGNVWCWGVANDGQLGWPSTHQKEHVPALALEGDLVTPMSGVVSLSAGHEHTCAVKADGSTWCFGNALYGRLGDGTNAMAVHMATRVLGAGGVGVLDPATTVTVGTRHTCAGTSAGWRCWGSNGAGALGDGTTVTSAVPVALVSPVPFTELAAGDETTCGVTPDHHVYCWGDGLFLVLGQSGGAVNASSVPLPVAGL